MRPRYRASTSATIRAYPFRSPPPISTVSSTSMSWTPPSSKPASTRYSSASIPRMSWSGTISSSTRRCCVMSSPVSIGVAFISRASVSVRCARPRTTVSSKGADSPTSRRNSVSSTSSSLENASREHTVRSSTSRRRSGYSWSLSDERSSSSSPARSTRKPSPWSRTFLYFFQ